MSDPLPVTPERILIAGTTGSGKTTLAGELSRRLDLPYTELDSLFHGPSWTPRPEFSDDLRAIAATDRWISEWGYFSSGVGPVLGARAQLLIWLDLPRSVALPRLIRRTLRRRIRREQLWSGNVEPPLHTYFTSDDHIIRWEHRTHRKWAERMPELERTYPHLTIVRLTTSREVRDWIERNA